MVGGGGWVWPMATTRSRPPRRPSLFRRTCRPSERDVAAGGGRSRASGARARSDLLLQRREGARRPRAALIVLHRLGARAGAVVEGDQALLRCVRTYATVVGAVEEVHGLDGA